MEESISDVMYVRLYNVDISRERMLELFVNSGDPDQTLRSAASDLGLHCLPNIRLGVSSLQWVNLRKLRHEMRSMSPKN